MLVVEREAQKKWCPMVRLDNSNRVYNTHTDPHEVNPLYRCLGTACMAWREFHLSHVKHPETGEIEKHGYCGLAGRPELE